MSNAIGMVRFEDGTIRHYEYYGSSDVCNARLYETAEERSANWRNHKPAECLCGNSEEVEIYSDYADGSFWEGRACKTCCAITAGRSPLWLEDEGLYPVETEGQPDWVREFWNEDI